MPDDETVAPVASPEPADAPEDHGMGSETTIASVPQPRHPNNTKPKRKPPARPAPKWSTPPRSTRPRKQPP
jgi:hypothetical protein